MKTWFKSINVPKTKFPKVFFISIDCISSFFLRCEIHFHVNIQQAIKIYNTQKNTKRIREWMV